MDYYKESLKMHEEHRGKMEVASKVKVANKDDLSTAYTPGVAEPCRKIHENPEDVYKYTNKSNTVAVISDGSAVLGLGNIGGLASIPVMDGKSLLFKEFAGIDAFPVCLETQDVDEIVNIAKNIAPTLGGINLEDIAAPRCFEIERKLQEQVDIPVFHDDQHGTAVVVTAAIMNALKITGKQWKNVKVVINGAGAAGTAIARMLLAAGAGDVIVCDQIGVLAKDDDRLNPAQEELARMTNQNLVRGTLADVMKGADVFVGVSAPRIVNEEMIASMAKDAIVFPMANPEPEIMPDLAKKAGARIVGTGRSDFPNQINNVLAFPGIFKGALEARAKRITEDMKIAAARALADIITEDELCEEDVYKRQDGVRKAVLDAKECFEAEGHVFQMRLVPGHMLGMLEEAFPDQMYFSEDRPNYDYVYRRSDLAELKGRDYHSKKNHLNYFRKNYSYEYVPLTSGMAWEAIEFVRELNRSRERSGHELELLKMEEDAMADVFCHMEEAGYMGGAIRIDGKMQALTVGGQLNLDTAVVHIEKANTNFRGLYQAINNEFCRNMPDSTEFVNREEDMGIPNLRKAKLSYKPVKMIEKYIAAFK